MRQLTWIEVFNRFGMHSITKINHLFDKGYRLLNGDQKLLNKVACFEPFSWTFPNDVRKIEFDYLPHSLKDCHKALQYFEEVRALVIESSLLLEMLGITHFRLGNNEEAFTFLDKAIVLDGNSALAYYWRGWVKEFLDSEETGLEKSASDDALWDYKRANNLVSDFYKAGEKYTFMTFELLGRGFRPPKKIGADYKKQIDEELKAGKLKDSLEWTELALDDFPDHPPFYVLRGEILKKLGRKKEAENNFYKAHQLNPKLAKTYCHRAQKFWFAPTKYKQTLRDFDRVLFL